MRSVDLNCDCGEGSGHDPELIPLVTSANVACGAHAGDAATMAATCRLAEAAGVAIGAHPGYADRARFGRVPMALSPAALTELLLDQLAALREHAPLRHVKPHGALYNRAAVDPEVARVVAEAICRFDRSLILFGLAGSCSIRAAEERGLRTAQEVFADRTYQADGTLTPRTSPGALIEDEERALEQVLRMVHEQRVRSVDGQDIAIRADTICLHGDSATAVAFARRIRAALERDGLTVRALPNCIVPA